jgi:flagellar biogenesis protein FliO
VRFISTAVLLVFLVAPMVQAEGVAAPDAAPAAVDDAADADAGDVGAAEGTGNEDTGPEVRPPPPPVDEELVKPFGTADIVKSLLRTTLMLAVVLGIVWLTLSKGMGKLVEKANAGKRVKVIERVALDARRSLFLVEVDGKQMVLGGGDVVRIYDFTPPAGKGFAEVLTTTAAAGSSATSHKPTTHSTAENA